MIASWLISAALAGAALGNSQSWGPSSPRKTVNFGPVNPSRSASAYVEPSNSVLEAFNREPRHSIEATRVDGRTSFGKNVAIEFMKGLVPGATFDVDSAFISMHSTVAHVHLTQTLSLGQQAGVARISNAVASVHVDVNPQSARFGQVLSFSESFHDAASIPDEHHRVERPTNFHHVMDLNTERQRHVTEWQLSCSTLQKDIDDLAKLERDSQEAAMRQQVLGGPAFWSLHGFDVEKADACQLGHLPKHLSGDVTTKEASSVVDPRVALVSFLTLVAEPYVLSHDVMPYSLDHLVDSMHIRPRLQSTPDTPEHNVEIMNAPGVAVTDAADLPTKAELAWLSVPKEDGNGRELQLTWRFEYRSDMNWYEGYVDATRPSLVASSIDWVKDFRPTTDALPPAQHFSLLNDLHASTLDRPTLTTPQNNKKEERSLSTSYRVFEWGLNDPSEGDRKLITDPAQSGASPAGWHTVPSSEPERPHYHWMAADKGWENRPGWSTRTKEGMNATDTRGNNVFAQENWEGQSRWENNVRPDAGSNMSFDFPLHWGSKDNRTGRHIEPKSYIEAAVTELFYTCNEIHDMFYLYGFDEVSGNFQQYNFGHGGAGDDAVIANAQDGSGYNNANFATPPDGNHGQMRMYVWDGPEPWRDGDLEAGIVIHEYAHGISTRLTGGPRNSGCLGWGEAGGMGEGWGDFFATMIRMHKKKPQDFSMGEWASGQDGGIRKYKYSLNHTTNIETYKTLDNMGYFGVHAIGEVWAEMLYTVAEAMIGKHGFESSLIPPSPSEDSDFFTISSKTGRRHPTKGNTLMIQLVVDAMKLQPCRPSFTKARDAILEADEILTGGDNRCDIWKAFASRGLGLEAALHGATPWGGGVREEDTNVPKTCE